MKKDSNKMKSLLLAIAVISGAFFCAKATSQNAILKQGQSNGDSTQASSPDFAVYRSQIEPIFLKERPGHARCFGCHTLSNRVFHLETLSPGRAEWTLEQSKRNYENAIRLVEPGQPVSSKLLLHPLAPEAGGNAFHSGGRQFASQNDPDWVTLADWVRSAGRSASAASLPATRIYVTTALETPSMSLIPRRIRSCR